MITNPRISGMISKADRNNLLRAKTVPVIELNMVLSS
jgi:hypothetical protein